MKIYFKSSSAYRLIIILLMWVGFSSFIEYTFASELSLSGNAGLRRNDAVSEQTNLVRKPITPLGWLNYPTDNAVEPLLRFLENEDPIQRFQAAWALGQLQDFENPTINNVLLRALTDKDPWVNVQVIETLVLREESKERAGLIKDDRVRKALLSEINNTDPYIRSSAIRGLHLWRSDAGVRAAIREGINDPIWLVRNASIWVELDDFGVLKEGASDEYPYSRRLAISHLAISPHAVDPNTRAILIERLRDPNRDVVVEAVHQLSALKDEKAIRPILDLLNLEFSRELVEGAIFKITGKSLDETIKEDKWKPDPSFKLDAYVKGHDRAEIEQLIKLLREGNAEERSSAVFQLTWVNDPSVVKPLLKEIIKDPEARLRYAALNNLEARANAIYEGEELHSAGMMAFPLIKDVNQHVRSKAMEMVGRIQAEKLTEEMRENLLEVLPRIIGGVEDPFTRSAAIRSLHLVKQDVQLQELLAKLANDEFFEIRIAVIRNLDLSLFPKGLNTVFDALNDPVPVVRITAINKFITKDYSARFAGNTKVVKALQIVSSNDSVLEVREAAAKVLKQLEHQRRRSKLPIQYNIRKKVSLSF